MTFDPLNVLPDNLFKFEPSFDTIGFLHSKESYLAGLQVPPLQHLLCDAIDQECAKVRKFQTPSGEVTCWGVPQKIILIRLQLEQSLIYQKTQPDMADPAQAHRQDYALGCGVTMAPGGQTRYILDDDGQPKWKGIERQVEGACNTLAHLFAKWKPGFPTSEKIDGVKHIVPVTAFSWSLYEYTPFGAQSITRQWAHWWPEDFPA